MLHDNAHTHKAKLVKAKIAGMEIEFVIRKYSSNRSILTPGFSNLSVFSNYRFIPTIFCCKETVRINRFGLYIVVYMIVKYTYKLKFQNDRRELLSTVLLG